MQFSFDASEIDWSKCVQETHPAGRQPPGYEKVNPAALEQGAD
jgi:hypothetical protein